MAFGKFGKFNKKFVDDRVDYAKVIETHLINISSISTNSSPDQAVNFINAVEQLYTLAHPLLNDEQFAEIQKVEDECDNELSYEKSKAENRVYRFRAKARETDIKRKYAERKNRLILKHIRHILISESFSAVEDEVPDYEDE